MDRIAFPLLLGLSLAPVLCRAAEPNADQAKATVEIELVDYAHPGVYRDFPDSLGDRAAILALASTLKGESDAVTIRNVLLWMDKNLKYDETKAYKWVTSFSSRFTKASRSSPRKSWNGITPTL